MEDLIVGLIIVTILGLAIYKLYWNKKNNVKCSGCSACAVSSKCDKSSK